MSYYLVLIPIIAAFIGWFTNWIAIKMLFHPRLPKKYWVLPFRVFFRKDSNNLLKNWANWLVKNYCLLLILKKRSPILKISNN